MAYAEFRGRSKKGLLTYRLKAYLSRVGEESTQSSVSTTWKAPLYMTQEEADEEAKAQAQIFENQVNGKGKYVDPNISLFDYCQYFIDTAPGSPGTKENYDYLLPEVKKFFKEEKASNVSSELIGKFYAYLPTRRKKTGGSGIANEHLEVAFNNCSISMNKFYSEHGVSYATLKAALKGKRVQWNTAKKISAALNQNPEKLFDFIEGSDLYSDEVIYKFHRFLHAVFEQSIRDELRKKNPCENVRPPTYPRNKAKYLDDELARAFLFTALRETSIKLKITVIALLFTGVRRGELMGLSWNDVAPIMCAIDINKSVGYTKKLGVYVKDTKNEKSERIVVIPAFVVDVFKEFALYSFNRMVMCKQKKDPEGRNWVFCQKSGAIISPKTMSNWLDKFSEKNNLPQYNPHAYRHTYITLQNIIGTDLSTLGASTGHASPKVLLGTYTHGVLSAKKKATEKYTNALFNEEDEQDNN